MKLRHAALLFFGSTMIVGWQTACTEVQPSSEPDQPPPHRVSPFPGDAQIFAKGIVSTELPEFAISFSPDGETVYFNRMPADRSQVRIWSSSLADGAWSEPKPLSFSDGKYRDVDPFVSLDGARLYFSSTRPIEGDEPRDYDLWFVEKTENGWGKPTNLGEPINSAEREIYSTLSKNGNLYFSVFETEGRGVGIYRSVWRNGSFQAPERLTIGSGTLRVTNPTIAPDESFLLFVSDHEGQADIYVSRRLADGEWAEIETLGPVVNSDYTEFAPSVSPDGTTLFFTSERPGVLPENAVEGRPPGDLYAVSLEAAFGGSCS